LDLTFASRGSLLVGLRMSNPLHQRGHRSADQSDGSKAWASAICIASGQLARPDVYLPEKRAGDCLVMRQKLVASMRWARQGSGMR
jgi:hypothetical protein